MARTMSTRKGLLITAYCLLILVGVALVYLGLRGTLPAIADLILPAAYIGVILLVVRYQMSASPREYHPFSFRIGIRSRYLIKSFLCLVIAFFWAVIVGSMTADTRIGNAVAAGPALGVVGVGAYFLYRSLPNWFRK